MIYPIPTHSRWFSWWTAAIAVAAGSWWAVLPAWPQALPAQAAEQPAVAIGDSPAEAFPRCADPAIIAAENGAGYYVFSTGRGIPILYSTDLRGWRRVGRVFDAAVPPWAAEVIPKASEVWAPDISHFAGKYHLYYAVSSFGSQRSAIGLARNNTLDRSRADYQWQDCGLVLESRPGECDFNAIDPALFVDGDGTPYLFWGSYWGGIKAARIDPASGKPRGGRPEIVPVARRAPGVNPPAIEAPFVIRREGYYYLFVSWDACCAGVKSTYKTMVGRAKAVLGPYLDADGKRMLDGHATCVLASSERWRGPGHNSVLHTPRQDWLVHACYDAVHVQSSRVLNVRPLYWKDGWPTAGNPLGDEHTATGQQGAAQK